MNMKKTIFATLAALTVLSCNRTPDPAVSVSVPTVNVGFEGTTERIAVDLKANREWTLTTDGQDWYTVEPMKGTGDATLYVTVQALEEVAARAAELKITAESAVASLSIVQGLPEVEPVKTGSFVIEEVFFAGFVPEGSSYSDAGDGDQWIKIRNNTDKLLYADKLAICFSDRGSQNGGFAYYEPTVILKDSIAVGTVYRIPGGGEDVPVLPGHSLTLALSAQNFQAENGAGADLSKADFEFFDGEDVDVDNPDVPNLESWVKKSASLTLLHNRGYFSVALAVFPENLTAETFMAEWPWVGTEKFIMDGEVLMEVDIDPGYYVMKNEWVVDGINLGVAEDIGRLEFNAAVDAGYTGCGEVDRDPGRYGKSALRKADGGKLVDTDNSTNDFTRDATPTLK